MSHEEMTETPTARAIRLIQEEERERCAALAEKIGKEYGEPAVGHSIAKQIREIRRN